MENILKQYAAISSKWINDNPVRAFLPFFYDYIQSKCCGGAIAFDKIKEGICKHFGSHFSFSLIQAVLHYLKNQSEASVDEDGYWSFSIKEKNKRTFNLDSFNAECAQLIDNFKAYLNEKGEDSSSAEPRIISFFNKYDHEIAQMDFDKCIVSIDSNESKENYLVADFIKNQQGNPYVFKFILNVARGSIVKTAIFFNKYNISFLKDQTYFLDTKVVLRLIGNYGEYFESEYTELVSTLIKHKAKVVVSQYVVEEIKRILRTCISYVESQDYDFNQSSELLRRFRVEDLSRQDVQEKLNSLENAITNKGVVILNIDQIPFPDFKKYHEDYEKLVECISPIYSDPFNNDENGVEYKPALETDINSIIATYTRYGGVSATSFKNVKCFFVTSNKRLIKEVIRYHNEVHGDMDTLIPFMSDDFLGILLSESNMSQISPEKISLLAFCNKCCEPTDEVINKYFAKVKSLREKGKISDDEVFLLKNQDLFGDAFKKGFINNNFMMDDTCVYNVLDKIKEKIKKDTVAEMLSKMKKEEENHQEVVKNKTQEIEDLHQTIAKQENQKNSYILLSKRDEHKKNHRIISTVYYCLLGVICLISIIVLCLSIFLFFDQWSSSSHLTERIICTSISSLFTIFSFLQFVFDFVKKKSMFSKIFSKIEKRMNAKSDKKVDRKFLESQ